MAAEPQTAFFSYSRDDSEFALRLAEDLKAAGANVWLDQLDIAPGQRWARAVQDALNNCQRMLVILSPASVSSTNVEDEVTFALEEHKTVIPVFYRDCKVPFQLRPFQYVDFRTDYDRGLKTLLRTLGAEQQRLEQEEEQAAKQARLEEQERERKAAEEKGQQFLSKKMMIGLAVGVVVLLLVGILWWRRPHNQTSQTQTAGPPPQSTQQQPQTAEPQTQTAVQPPQGTGPQPQAPAADVKKPVAKNCPEGVYCDPETKLMWTIKDSGKDVSWQEADQYCRSLPLAGLSGWELPTIDELERLYDPQNSSEHKIRKPFQLTGYWAWSSTKEGSGSYWYFGFNVGKRFVPQTGVSYNTRALCVRQSTGRQPQPSAADAKKPVAKNCPEGVFCDPDTNLMWTIKDNGEGVSWQEADQYCKSRTLAGLSGWELPPIEKLEKLYDPQQKSDYRIRKSFQLTSRFVWSWAREGSRSAWFFSFGDGRRYNVPVGYSSNYRVLCVRRSGK